MRSKLKVVCYLFFFSFCFFSIAFGQVKDEEINDSIAFSQIKTPLPQPEAEDYSFLVEINDKTETRVSIVVSDQVDFLTMNSSQTNLGAFFSNLSPNIVNSNKKSKAQKPLKERNVYIKAAPSSMFFEIDLIIKTIKKNGMNKIFLLVPRGEYNEKVPFLFPSSSKSNKPPTPNPLFLIANIYEGSVVTLNTENYGTVKDLSVLEKRLKEVFKERRENATFRRGTSEVETTVFVNPSKTNEFANITKLINAILDAGSDSVGIPIK